MEHDRRAAPRRAPPRLRRRRHRHGAAGSRGVGRRQCGGGGGGIDGGALDDVVCLVRQHDDALGVRAQPAHLSELGVGGAEQCGSLLQRTRQLAAEDMERLVVRREHEEVAPAVVAPRRQRRERVGDRVHPPLVRPPPAALLAKLPRVLERVGADALAGGAPRQHERRAEDVQVRHRRIARALRMDAQAAEQPVVGHVLGVVGRHTAVEVVDALGGVDRAQIAADRRTQVERALLVQVEGG